MARPLLFLFSLTFSVALVAFYIYRKFFCHNYFKKLGIPGPQPHWLFGNLRELWATKDRHIVLQNWGKKYGSIFGYYSGSTPILVVSDPQAVESLCIKQFRTFPGRKPQAFLPTPERYPHTPLANVASLWGDQWKRLRTIVNPGFSTGRLKTYTPLIHKSQHELMDLFRQFAAKGDSFEATDVFQYLALDIISEVAFGVELNSIKHRGAENPLLPMFTRLQSNIITAEMPIIKLAACLPELAPLFQGIIMAQRNLRIGVLGASLVLADMSSEVIERRVQDSSLKRNDLLQMLIEAMDDKAIADKTLAPLTQMEVLAQTIQLFSAGTTTSRFTLSYAAYCLASNPECQEKLFKELMENWPVDKDATPDYDTIMKMSYLDWFIHETIRLYPIAVHFVTRFVDEPTTINGISVDEKAAVMVDVWSVHQDAELWGPVDPAKFHPERFSADYPTTANRPSTAFLGFGAGPRICLGMRLALYELKLTISNIVRRFEVLPPEGGYPSGGLPVQVSIGMLPRNGVWVRLRERAN